MLFRFVRVAGLLLTMIIVVLRKLSGLLGRRQRLRKRFALPNLSHHVVATFAGSPVVGCHISDSFIGVVLCLAIFSDRSMVPGFIIIGLVSTALAWLYDLVLAKLTLNTHHKSYRNKPFNQKSLPNRKPLFVTNQQHQSSLFSRRKL